MWEVLVEGDGQEISGGSAEYSHGRGLLSLSIRSISILQEGFLEFVLVEVTGGRGVPGNDPLH